MITANQILEYSSNKTLDAALTTTVIKGVQLTYIREFLGADFYTSLLAQHKAGTLTAANQTLLEDYLQPAMAYYCLFDVVTNLSSEVTSTGVMSMFKDGATPANQSDVAFYRTSLKSKAEKLLDMADKYMRDNSSSYPLYSCGSDVSSSSFPYCYYSTSEPNLSKNG